MLNYQSLEALATVVQLGSFSRASKALHVTQPAISSRIKSLEDELGLVLLKRSQPIRPTEEGHQLIEHFVQVQHLEKDLRIRALQCQSETELRTAIVTATQQVLD